MRLCAALVVGLAAFCVLCVGRVPAARGASADRAARGLDVFVHVPQSGSVERALPVQLEVFGFPTVQSAVPLANAKLACAKKSAAAITLPSASNSLPNSYKATAQWLS